MYLCLVGCFICKEKLFRVSELENEEIYSRFPFSFQRYNFNLYISNFENIFLQKNLLLLQIDFYLCFMIFTLSKCMIVLDLFIVISDEYYEQKF